MVAFSHRAVAHVAARRALAARERSAPIFAALGDRTRLRLVERLSSGEALTIAALSDGADITRQAVTKHLRVLEGCGIVQAERRGREQRYRLDSAPLAAASEWIDERRRLWESRFDRLGELLREDAAASDAVEPKRTRPVRTKEK
jgi:DNA-binding transcriptional ArsR family regulator